MTFLHNAFYFVISLTILVFVHEWGHFLAARWVGVKVLRFSIGFGKPIFRYIGKKGTEYVLSLIPLGGYVKMLDEDEAPVDEKEKPYAFNQQSVWARMIIVVAGPLFNFFFSIIALTFMFMLGIKTLAPVVGEVEPYSIASKAGIQRFDEIQQVGDQQIKSWSKFSQSMVLFLGKTEQLPLIVKNVKTDQTRQVMLNIANWQLDTFEPDVLKSLGLEIYRPKLKAIIGEVVVNSPASQAGLKAGDIILMANDSEITYWQDLLKFAQDNKEDKINLLISREGKELKLTVSPDTKVIEGKQVSVIGVLVKQQWLNDHWQRLQQYQFGEALSMGASQTKQLIDMSLQMMWKVLAGEISAKNIGGPIGIAQGAGQSASIGLSYYLYFLSLISVSLGVINLMPLPVLDGGHLLFLAIELIIGRQLNRSVREKASVVGIMMILALTALAMFNDITRLLY